MLTKEILPQTIQVLVSSPVVGIYSLSNQIQTFMNQYIKPEHSFSQQ